MVALRCRECQCFMCFCYSNKRITETNEVNDGVELFPAFPWKVAFRTCDGDGLL
jgi:hypothetical protein